MEFEKKLYISLFKKAITEEKIKPSKDIFKIKLFLTRAESSLLIAKHIKEFKVLQGDPPRLQWDYWAIIISYYAMLYAAKSAILSKGYEVNNHDAAQIALGNLLVPDRLEKEDLEILNQAYKIFEEEYVYYFEDAKTESHIARYSAIKTYSERRLQEVFENATNFVAKIILMLQD